MQLQGTRFGDLEYTPDKVIEFPRGILGFPDHRHFLAIPHPAGGPFAWLQTLEDPALAFPVIDPTLFRPDYRPQVRQEDMAALELASIRDGIFLALCVIPADPSQMRANLVAPVVVNPVARRGMQVVLENTDYKLCHYILQELAERLPKEEEVPQAAAAVGG
ncbi:MAG: flagellar assembly protein FliW [Thermaerobacter sp.]|nr:flagellar assembly protein FliW [Thermaerobacter sp.]MDA8146011.1 flagellar assembly protein FliW [Thermaerobacter sp.]